MPPKTPRLKFAHHTVTTVVVSHDGARWLPTCLAALAAQTRHPQRVVAVDTSSEDESRSLLAEALGVSAVLTAPRTMSLGGAVQIGLDAFTGAPPPPGVSVGPGDPGAPVREWVWLLHDDCAPEPTALERLLARAAESPSVAVIGPKVTSWDGRRLVEVGITVDSAGQRETGLDPREVDQGQHDDAGDVLAVGTAGMLVRRDVWDRLDGLDDTWPLFGEDIDFGWRVNASGGRVVVAPQAVVRHAGALGHGLRVPAATTGRPGSVSRRHGMQVLLANTASLLVPVYVLRFVVESLLRALATAAVLRRPARAYDEVAALVALLGSPLTVVRARRRRRALRQRTHAEIRPLLAPAGLRLRHFGDAVAAVFAGRAAGEDRRRPRAPIEPGPVSEEAESFEFDEVGLARRVLRRPGVLLVLSLSALAVVADRHLFGGALHGGRLLPAPPGASDLWSTYLASWHPVGVGSTTSSPPSLAGVALLATVFGGKPWLAVDVLMLAAVPLAGLSAYLAAGALTRRWVVRVWAAGLYALLPATTGAIAGGRIDVVVVVVLLPVVARACAAALREDPGVIGWHRVAGAGLLLAVVCAFGPVLWVAAVLPLVVAAPFAARTTPVARPGNGRRRLLAAVAMLAMVPVLLVPWVPALIRSPRLLLEGSGLPETLQSRHPVAIGHLMLLHPGGPAEPTWWVWAPVLLAAVVALSVVVRRHAASVGFGLVVAGVAAAAVASRLGDASANGAATRYWTGAALSLAGMGALMGFAVVVDRLPDALRNHAFGWRQSAAAVLVLGAVLTTFVTAGGWVSRGSAKPLTASDRSALPVFAVAAASAPTAPRVLVLQSHGGVVHYAVLRRPSGLELGDADVAPGPARGAANARSTRTAERLLAVAVRDAAAGRDAAGAELAEFGVALVVVPADSSGELSRLAGIVSLARVPASLSTVYRSATAAGELTVLSGSDVAAARHGRVLGASAHPVALPSTPGHAHTSLAAGTGSRLLVLAEPVDNHWVATLDGRRLSHTTAYGWAQSWVLPVSGGTLSVSRADSTRAAWLIAEAVALLVACLLAVPTRRFGRRGADEEQA